MPLPITSTVEPGRTPARTWARTTHASGSTNEPSS